MDTNASENTFQWAETLQNFSIDDYLEKQLGPKHLPKDIVIALTVVYIVIFLTGLIGNISVCLVIVKRSSMQTATNYYLFSLAVSDLLLLIFGLPYDLQLFWQQYPWELGEAMCRARALISEMTNYASVLTIVAFTVERYIAICHPLFSQTTSSLPRVIKIIAANWVIAAIIATPYAVLTSVYYIDFPRGSNRFIKESAFCMMPTDPKDNQHFRPLLCFSSLAFFFIPMSIIVILYMKIGITLRKSAAQSNECSALHKEGKPSGRKAIIRMLFAVVIAFIICWAPFHAQRLLFVYAYEASLWPVSLRKLNEILYFAGCFYYFNATINPILYNVMSAKYREAFREILCEFCPHFSFCRLATKARKQHHGLDNGIMADGRRTSSMVDTYTIFDDGDCSCERSSITLTLTLDSDECERYKGCGVPNGKSNENLMDTKSMAIENKTKCLQIPNSSENPNKMCKRMSLNLKKKNRVESCGLDNESSVCNNKQIIKGRTNKSKCTACIPTFNLSDTEKESVL